MARTKYRFTGQSGGRYYWESVLPVSPGDSRYDHVSCDVGTFWGEEPVIHGTCVNEAYDHKPHMYGVPGLRFFCNGDVGYPPEQDEVKLRSPDGTRGAEVYPVAGHSGSLWRIRLEKYPEHSVEGHHGWFGGKVLWGYDRAVKGDAVALARVWTVMGRMPERAEGASNEPASH